MKYIFQNPLQLYKNNSTYTNVDKNQVDLETGKTI